MALPGASLRQAVQQPAASSQRPLAGARNNMAVSLSASQSALDTNTASPRREVISTASRLSLTCSMSGKRFLRASLAVTDMTGRSVGGEASEYRC